MPPQSIEPLKAHVAKLEALNKQLEDVNQKLREEITVLSQAQLHAEQQNATSLARITSMRSTVLATVSNTFRPSLRSLTQILSILTNIRSDNPKQEKSLRRVTNRLKHLITNMAQAIDGMTYLDPLPPDLHSTGLQSKTPDAAPPIYVLDGDCAALNGTRAILERAGYAVETFTDAKTFLGAYLLGAHRPNKDGCIILDAQTLEMDGFALIERLRAASVRLPSIIVTTHASARHGDASPLITGKNLLAAKRSNVADFVEKPINQDKLLATVQLILNKSTRLGQLPASQEQAMAKIALLSARECEVLALVLEGRPSKNIAVDLGVSQRTIDNHRAAIMKKMGVKSLAQLVRLVLAAERIPPASLEN